MNIKPLCITPSTYFLFIYNIYFFFVWKKWNTCEFPFVCACMWSKQPSEYPPLLLELQKSCLSYHLHINKKDKYKRKTKTIHPLIWIYTRKWTKKRRKAVAAAVTATAGKAIATHHQQNKYKKKKKTANLSKKKRLNLYYDL